MGFGTLSEASLEEDYDAPSGTQDGAPRSSGSKVKKRHSLANEPTHIVDLKPNGFLVIHWKGVEVAALPPSGYKWSRIKRISSGKVALSSFLDGLEKKFGIRENGRPNINYITQSMRWIDRSIKDNSKNRSSKRRLSKSNIDDANLSSFRLTSGEMKDLTNELPASGPLADENVSRVIDLIASIKLKGANNVTERQRSQAILEELNKIVVRLNNENSSMQNTCLVLPDRAEVKYLPRKSGKASEFLRAHWGIYIDAGIMFRPDLKRLDPKLEMALANEFRGRTDELRAILPTQSDATDARLAAEFGAPVRPEDRKAAITASSIARRYKTAKL